MDLIPIGGTYDDAADSICPGMVTDCDYSSCRDKTEDLFSYSLEDVFDCPVLNCPRIQGTLNPMATPPDSSVTVYLLRWSLIVVATATILLAEI